MIDLTINVKRSSLQSSCTVSIMALFEEEYCDILARLDDLQGAVEDLSLQEKGVLTQTTRKIGKAVTFFKKKLRHHMALDEKVIFPYVLMNLPKLEGIVGLLHAERHEFERSFEKFDSLFSEFNREHENDRQQRLLIQLKEKGGDMICLMRNHIHLEVESVYKTIDHELPHEDKKSLIARCVKSRMRFV